MDEPARRMVAVGKTRPEQPEAPPFFVLDPVIVADRIDSARSFRPPPFFGDPLRPVGARHPVWAPPPRKTKRRVVGQQPKSGDRLRRLEQPDRTRRFGGMITPFCICLEKLIRDRGARPLSARLRGERDG